MARYSVHSRDTIQDSRFLSFPKFIDRNIGKKT